MEAYEKLKEKLQEIKEAFEQMKTNFRDNTEQLYTGLVLARNRNPFIEDMTRPLALKEEYGLLESLNIWNRINSWTRPKISSAGSSLLPSLALELSDRTQPESLNFLLIERFEYKFYRDTSSNVHILSVKIYTSVEHLIFEEVTMFKAANIKLLPNMCGKGLCFILKKIDGGYHIILIHDIRPQNGKKIDIRAVNIMIRLSRSDSLNLDIHDLGPTDSRNNEVFTKTLTNLRVVFNRDGNIVHDTVSGGVTLNIVTLVECQGVTFHADGPLMPYTTFSSELNGPNVNFNPSNVSVKNGALLSVIQLNLNDPRLKDGVLFTSLPVKIFGNTILGIQKRYLVYARGKQEPTLFEKKTIIAHTNTNSFPMGSHAALYFTIYGLSSPRVSVYKIANSIGRTDFPAFEYLVSRYTRFTVLVIQTYYTQLEDAGTYLIEARSGTNMVFKNFTLGIYEEKTRIEMFEREYKTILKNETAIKVVELKCIATGKPSPTIEYYEGSVSHSGMTTLKQHLKNDDTFHLMPMEVKNGIITRSIIVQKFPNTTYYEFPIICKASNNMDYYTMTENIYIHDFE